MNKLMVLAVFLLVAVGCSVKPATTPQTASEQPPVFCEVVHAPDPLLLGTWEGYFVRSTERDTPDNNYVRYRLIKDGDRYGLYFYRTWKQGRKKVAEWKNWTIDGQQISGEPKYGVRIFVEGKEVFFTIRGLDEPAKLTRVKE